MKAKPLSSMETLSERFTLVDSGTTPAIVEVKLDGVSISIADLVKCCNQLSTALENRGCYFTVSGKKH